MAFIIRSSSRSRVLLLTHFPVFVLPQTTATKPATIATLAKQKAAAAEGDDKKASELKKRKDKIQKMKK